MTKPAPTVNSPALRTEDRWVQQSHGRVFTRTWYAPDSSPKHDNAPIILFHDSLGSVELWRQFPALLCRETGQNVIAFDRWGFGNSDPRPDHLAVTFVADEAQLFFPALCSQLHIDHFIALGHSVGGAMAIETAAQHAARCDGLITIAAQVFAEKTTLSGIRQARTQFTDAAQFDRLARYHAQKTRWVLDAWINSWLDPGFANWNLRKVLPYVRCPSLVIHGDQDEYGTPIHPRIIKELSGGPVHTEILRGAGHLPHRECPETIVALICAFASGLRNRVHQSSTSSRSRARENS